MARNDRAAEDAPAAKSRRRRPPVLELKATEVGAEASKARADQPKADAPRQARSNPWTALRERLAALDWMAIPAPALVAGGIGTLAGAVGVLLVVILMDRGGDPRLASLTGEIAALTARIETLATRPRTGDELSALAERINRLTATIDATEQRLAAVENRLAPQLPDPVAADRRTAAIEATLKDLRSALADLRRVAEQTSPAAAAPAAVETLSGRIGALEERIVSLATTGRASAGSSLTAEISALNSLNGALNSGRPFAQEIASVRALMGERASSLAQLDPTAGEGLPTTAMLARRFAELAPALLRGPDPDGSFLARLMSNAVRLVEVRPVGEPPGTSVGAVVARMETKLDRGDLPGALDESSLLPPAAKAAAADWIAAASRRRDGESAIKKLIDAALAAPASERTRP